jgi:hypothetical protein
MTLYAGVPLKPGDLMELEFLTPGGARIAAVVRSRTGFCFGLEFLTPLSGEPRPTAVPLPAPVPRPAASAVHIHGQAAVQAPSTTGDLKSVLRNKEQEIQRLKKEIATLRTFGKL